MGGTVDPGPGGRTRCPKMAAGLPGATQAAPWIRTGQKKEGRQRACRQASGHPSVTLQVIKWQNQNFTSKVPLSVKGGAIVGLDVSMSSYRRSVTFCPLMVKFICRLKALKWYPANASTTPAAGE